MGSSDDQTVSTVYAGQDATARTVLLLEDDEVIAAIVVDALSRDGLGAQWCADAEAAEAALEQGDFRVCLVDRALPTVDGLTFIERLRKKHPGMGVIVISALGGLAFAGEGNSEPFANNEAVLSTRTADPFPARSYAGPDVGSNQYPHVAGRPGTNLTALDNEVLPTNGSQGPVQTANSLPRGFEQGTVAYAQARSVHNWMTAHGGAAASRVAGR